ncbi:hypothetical protein KUTeg_017955 [Tegillarca granosa]|uniref:Ig-like domain-containing protein n=1 Tax=Tegillarca granosa TaxID=220873 RepID=A0ABQ9EGF2_TEGGR|nr:hypothetical protein KUTeg_017955 [Tegillarca granosa]
MYAYVPTLPPSFLPVPKNFTYNKGELAELRCAVANLGTKSICLLKTYKMYRVKRFADDRRYQSRNIPYKDEWNLIIRNVQPVDSGIYECQVSSKRRTLRQNITLTVKEISINGTKFVERGDPILIKCNATGEEFPPDDIQWYKEGNKIKSDPRRNLVVKKEVKMRSRSLLSSLEIAHASMEDAGTYVCRTTSRELAISFPVNVLNDAM